MATKQLSIRLEESTEEEIKSIAEAEHRSLNGQITKALEEWLIFSYSWEPSLEETIAEVEKGNIEPAYKGENG